MKKACVNCEYWRRNGTDGICFGGTPNPKIVVNNKEYVLMWPRTQVDERCPTFSSVEEDED